MPTKPLLDADAFLVAYCEALTPRRACGPYTKKAERTMKKAVKIHGASFGRSQKTKKLAVAPSMQKTQVRIVRLLKTLSVTQPATIVPKTPPISSEAATIEAARAIGRPLYWVRNMVPHSRIVKRIT